MRCPRCQHENGPQAKFCQECAAPLARTCAKCGSELPSTAKFCPECAHPAADAVSINQGRLRSPETYTPKHLAERILTSKAALEGERKQVTVLFADLKGSMELLADRDPEEARKILDPVLERMMEAVHRYEGTVNQVMGDGIMALFGAPLAHEDHAVRACYAALRMQESVKRYAAEARRSEGLLIQIRVGLNSGEVVVRSVGSDLRMDYTAVGQITHLAARMEQMAAPGTILISPDVLRLAEGYVAVTPLGPVVVKGVSGPLEIYEVTGSAAVRTRLQAAAARGFTRFVGRDPELDLLRRALEQADAGHGQVVAVVGEPGVGKSRLYWEFTHSHRTHGWLLLESASVSYGKASTYLPVVDLLKGYFKINGRDDHRAIHEKVSGKLVTLDQSLLPTLPAFLALLDLPVEDEEWPALEPRQRRQRTLDACRRLLLRESRVQPLALMFEDLHWIDSETQALLDSLVESLPSARILLLVNYRPEYQHGWGNKTYYTQLRLDPLAPESGGKALLTVRELSVLTITEDGGRATVDLQSGKVGLAVVRQRMKPGEIIEIRTPHAVAAVRGTVLVVEIVPGANGEGQAGAGPTSTNVHLLHGKLDVSRLSDPAHPIQLESLQSVTVSRHVLGTVRPLTPEGAAAVTANLKMNRPSLPGPPEKLVATIHEKQRTLAVETASELVNGGPAKTRVAALAANLGTAHKGKASDTVSDGDLDDVKASSHGVGGVKALGGGHVIHLQGPVGGPGGGLGNGLAPLVPKIVILPKVR